MQYKHNTTLVSNARALRKNMTKEERHLWYDFLKNYPVRFLKQKILGNYIVDFYCASAKIVVELDGGQHFEPGKIACDAQRTRFLKDYGLQIIRIPNNEVMQNFRGVFEFIDATVQQSLSQLR